MCVCVCNQLENERKETIRHANVNQIRAGAAELISDKVDFRGKITGPRKTLYDDKSVNLPKRQSNL